MNKLVLIILSFFVFITSSCAQDLPQGPNLPFAHKTFYAQGLVQEILEQSSHKELEDAFGSQQIRQVLDVKILNGELKGQEVAVENFVGDNPAYDINLKKGDRVLLEIDESKDDYTVNITSKDRSPIILATLGLFFVSLLVVGGYRGFSALLSISITATLVFFVLIPAFLNGVAPIPVTIGVSVISTLMTMFIVGGINIKSLSATIGTIITLALAGVLSSLIINIAELNGVHTQEAIILWSNHVGLNFKGILTSAMIIAALGAVMDVGMSIASCINEIKDSRDDFGFQELFSSGMNVGKDIIGTMSNTLIFAYIGSSMPLLLLSTSIPFQKFINLNSVVTEILAALIGSIAIVGCVPITAAITAYLIHEFSQKSNNSCQ